MPNKLKRVSGKEVIGFCRHHGFEISRIRGSHVNLVRVINRAKQIITIPAHKEIDRGTLHQIFKKLLPHIPEHELRAFFYTSNKK